MAHRTGAAALAVAASALLLFAGCGSGGDEGTVDTTAQAPEVTMPRLARSVEAQAEEFLRREGTAVHRSLEKFLGPKITTEVARNDTECRPGGETASIANPREFPFACIVEGSADGRGLT